MCLTISPHDGLLPCFTVLTMGWSWSLHICQTVVRAVVPRSIGEGPMLADGFPVIVVQPKGPCVGAACVDNFDVPVADPVHVSEIFNAGLLLLSSCAW